MYNVIWIWDIYKQVNRYQTTSSKLFHSRLVCKINNWITNNGLHPEKSSVHTMGDLFLLLFATALNTLLKTCSWQSEASVEQHEMKLGQGVSSNQWYSPFQSYNTSQHFFKKIYARGKCSKSLLKIKSMILVSTD